VTPPPPWRLQSFAVLESTQTLCRQLAEAGEPDRLAIIAARQTQGQGTQGRGWESPAGNLFLSVMLRPDARVDQAGQWALLAAVALAETVAGLLTAASDLRLKWPNDLLLGGAKLAGILTQTAGRPDGALDWLVIGFGVNLRTAPALPDRPTACLPVPASPEPFAANLLRRIDFWRDRLAIEGFAPVRDAWLCFAPEPGAPVALRLPARTVHGGFAGLRDDGRLLLTTDGTTHAFAAGEL
jgi:BirA family biotin operon repressor/biotin-[acetyl-CoA-carboxylase] ligase